jgi:predicted enzyme related to lactoylglutathione lyase
MGRPVAFFEILSTDAERIRKFYSELFEWTAEADRRWAATPSSTPAPADGRPSAAASVRWTTPARPA